jgi:hypothetical protein
MTGPVRQKDRDRCYFSRWSWAQLGFSLDAWLQILSPLTMASSGGWRVEPRHFEQKVPCGWDWSTSFCLGTRGHCHLSCIWLVCCPSGLTHHSTQHRAAMGLSDQKAQAEGPSAARPTGLRTSCGLQASLGMHRTSGQEVPCGDKAPGSQEALSCSTLPSETRCSEEGQQVNANTTATAASQSHLQGHPRAEWSTEYTCCHEASATGARDLGEAVVGEGRT